MRRTVLLTCLLAFLSISLYAQPGDTMDVFDRAADAHRRHNETLFEFSMGYTFMQHDLKAFNESLPEGSRVFGNQRHNISLAMAVTGRKLFWEIEGSFSPRQRSFLSDHEQFYISQMRISTSVGPNFTFGKEKNIHLGISGGLGYAAYNLYYQNDSLFKESSIPWIVNLPQYIQSDDDDPNHYTSWALLVLGQVKGTWIIKNRFSVSGFAGWQQDLSNPKWEYQTGFLRNNSPETRLSGLYAGIRLGVLLY